MSIAVSFDDGRADVTLDRPDVLNAMDFDMFDRLAAACAEVARAPDVRVVVLSGAGRAFCSGIDVAAFGSESGDPGTLIARAQAGFRALAALEVPTVAAVHGYALGAGLQLALACDLRIVARDAVVGLLELKFGIVPDLGGTHRLPALVGPGYAKKMMWLQEKIDGRDAHRLGLAEVLTEPDDFVVTVDDVARRLCAAPPDAARAVKRLVDGAARLEFAEGMDAEAAEQARLLGSIMSS